MTSTSSRTQISNASSRLKSEAARRILERRRCTEHPANLLRHVNCVDSTTGEIFRFQLEDPDSGWYWQRELLDEWLDSSKHISLKARQLGITWLAGGLALWTALYVPGSNSLIVSIKEEDAVKVIGRVWDMLQSLPPYLWNSARVIKPKLGIRPTSEIQLEFPNGKVSQIRGLTSTPTAGHGATAALVVLDEFSRHPYATETWKAVLPTTQGGGRVLVISTGNGVSNPTGGGNYFHHLWVNASGYGLNTRFLPWNLHPDRDEVWYRIHAMALPTADRGEQYPRDEDEAFIFTGSPYFDVEAMKHYASHLEKPKYRMDFDVTGYGERARKKEWDHGHIRIFEEPEKGAKYAIGADVATGRGMDFSAAYVVRLDRMKIVAEFHGKLDPDLYAVQLHFLGRWYNTAILAVETAGGYGDAVIIPLRDGKSGRPPYPRLYQHQLATREDLPIVKPFGYPMTERQRQVVISHVERAIRERDFDAMPERLWQECRTFVHADTYPSPRADTGCNDDCVMALGIALEMYRQRGHHYGREQRLAARKRTKEVLTSYPWQPTPER